MTQEQREARLRQNVPFEIVLVRHSEPDWEREKGDPGLTELGRVQAARAAANLRTCSIHAIYCSPLRRARETAQALGTTRQLTPQITDDFEEIRVPALRKLTQSEVDSYFAAAARRTLQDRWSGFTDELLPRLIRRSRIMASIRASAGNSQFGMRPRELNRSASPWLVMAARTQ